MLDINKLRADTPNVESVIHFNSAGASLMPRVVVETVAAHLRRESEIGGYESADEAHERLDGVYRSIGRLLNADPAEIAVVENATRAWDMAFYTLPLRAGDVILTAANEYAGNYIPYLQMKRRLGVEVRVIPNDEQGQVSVAALRAMLADKRVRLVSLPMIGTNGGPVQPVEAIGAAARAAGVWFLLDACQGAGQVPLDVRRIGCHMLSATSRKYLRGPRGMGFLYVERELADRLEPVLLDLHAATLETPDTFTIAPGARRFENWEYNVAAKLGMGAAVDYALSLGMDAIWARIQQVSGALRARLAQIDGVTVTDAGPVKSGIVTFSVRGKTPNEVRAALAAHTPRINVTTTTDRGTMLDMQARGLTAIVRASVHAFNTDAEIETMTRAVERLI
ncbi:MAG: aminotransferase class V-fold PLP-dependent enzyme [Chloroflexi bacterium]|nr:aminotransferase class V-fold PLP-dependent enzyme [Chloroflexota bacterium]